MACTEASSKRTVPVLVKRRSIVIVQCLLSFSRRSRSQNFSYFQSQNVKLLSLHRSIQPTGLNISMLDPCLVTSLTTAS